MFCSIAMVALLGGCGAGDKGVGSDALAAVGAQQAEAGSGAESGIRSFRDWRTACDNGGDCFAFTGGSSGAFVRILMSAGPEADPQVVIGVSGREDAEQFEISIDAGTHRLEATPRSGWAGIAEARGDQARDLITAMSTGRDMTLTVDGESGPLSLAGASAALLWIDERQGRLDTVTALLRRGDRPASAVPTSAPLPAIRPRPASISQFSEDRHPPLPDSVAARSEITACREGWGDPGSFEDDVRYAELGPSTRLWAVPCFRAAYNTGHILFLTDHLGETVRPVTLPGFDPTDDVLLNVEIGRTVTHSVRNRGLGDCGLFQQWRWGQRGFELALEKRMDDCWGMPPEMWPTLWRTQ